MILEDYPIDVLQELFRTDPELYFAIVDSDSEE